MIVECPNCRSTFNLPDELVPSGGRKVKCSVCEHVFPVRPAAAAKAPAPPAPAEDDDLDDGLEGLLDEAFDGDGDDAAGADDAAEARAPARQDDDAEDAGRGERRGGLGFDLDTASAKKKSKGGKGKLVGIIAACVLAVLLAAGGGVYFFAPGLIGLAPSGDQAPQDGQASAAPADQVKNIYLEGIRQYYVENDKTGRVFVVEGKAVNKFETPKELVEVEANLYDAGNAVLDTVRLMCGNTLSLFQLQVLSREEIERALADQAGIGANNVNLQPGQSVPFMIVFFAPPDSVAEFNVSVVAAKNVDL